MLIVTHVLVMPVRLSAQQRVRLDVDYPLKAGNSATVENGVLITRFDGVTNDSRCPENARCATAGDATVIMTVTLKGGQPRRIELHTDDEPRTAEIPGFDVSLVMLGPRPTMDRPIVQRDYVATLRVQRHPEAR